MTDIDLAMTGRYLPSPMPTFSLAPARPLAEGLRATAMDQFDRVIDGLTDGSDPDTAVHEARKAMKRIRALLRLVRPVIGDEVYRTENAILRDTARVIAPIRDGRVMIDTVRTLRDRYDRQLQLTAFGGLEAALVGRHQRTRAVLIEDSGALRRTAYVLRSARARYASWPVDHEVAGHKPIPHQFESVGWGLEATYQRGRDEMRTALDKPTAENFHLWRKRAKYLRHQTELLNPLWPDVLGSTARELDHLGEILGAEHDLAVLLYLIVQGPELCVDPIERSLLVALAQHRRKELQAAATTIGARIYAERPKDLYRRYEAYWNAWVAEQTPQIPHHL